MNDPNAYQAKNFTLHGLWPNNDSCNDNYEFCGSTKKVQGSFCNYPEVPMSAETLKVLGKYMPSAAAMSCLQRHEWYKHGTCQTTWDADGYYDSAIRLTKEFNAGVGAFMAANIGESVATQDFFAVINQAFGADAHKRLQMKCKNGLLVDIYVNLPKDQLDRASLSSLIQAGAQDFSNGCGATFKVDAIGQ